MTKLQTEYTQQLEAAAHELILALERQTNGSISPHTAMAKANLKRLVMPVVAESEVKAAVFPVVKP
jgi:hypothetical protein